MAVSKTPKVKSAPEPAGMAPDPAPAPLDADHALVPAEDAAADGMAAAEPVPAEAAAVEDVVAEVADAAASTGLPDIADAAAPAGLPDIADAAAAAAGPDAGAGRIAAAFELPRLVGGFLERQARRSMDGAIGLARCRSLGDAVDLQSALLRDSVSDFVDCNGEIAARALTLAAALRPPFTGTRFGL